MIIVIRITMTIIVTNSNNDNNKSSEKHEVSKGDPKDAHGIGDQEYGKPKKKAFRNGKPRYPEFRLEQGMKFIR
jgi:hypothetical protein